jgi:glycosyltransferase involved in cell wall biosynthesis
MSAAVSVVIPVFNRAVAVRRAIGSVLAQTCQNFELIVVDDGSTDTTASSVAAFADRRIRLIHHEWKPTKLQQQLEVFERSNNEQLGLVYTGAEWILPDGRAWLRIPRRELELTRALLTENVIGETSVGMVRRSALDAIGGFDESLPSCQDMDLWLRICERFQVEIVPEALVRVTKENDTGRITNNVTHALTGRARFCQKHREKLLRHRVLHLYLRKSGWWQQRRLRDSRVARRSYLESLRANPFALFTYVMLIAAYLPMSCFDMLARCKQFVAPSLRLGTELYFVKNSARPTWITRLRRNILHDSSAS